MREEPKVIQKSTLIVGGVGLFYIIEHIVLRRGLHLVGSLDRLSSRITEVPVFETDGEPKR